MYSSAFYKLDARNLLKKNYKYALVASLIFIIPSYVLSLKNFLFIDIAGSIEANILSTLIDAVVSVFVISILNVGFYRFFLNLKRADDPNINPESKRYDYNLVVSGFTMNYANTLKITFLMNLYLFLWILLALVPSLLFVGIMSYLIATTEVFSTLYSLLLQLNVSTSYDMLNTISDYVSQNCPYLPVVITSVFFLTIAGLIPFIMKYFEYAAIPMILANDPDISSEKAFKRSKNIMCGFRVRYFFIQLSFLHFIFLAAFIMLISQSMFIYYLAIALLQPYVTSTLLAFYKERREILDYNISLYGEH